MKSVLIYSGSNYRAIIAFCRYAELNNIEVHIVSNGKDDLIKKTKYADKIIHTRVKNKLDVSELLHIKKKIKEQFSVSEFLVLPSTEFLNRFLVNNETVLASNNIFTGLCSKSLYSEISNKYSFGKLATKYGIKIPKEYPDKPIAFPYVVKPKKYFSTTNTVNTKPIIVNKTEDLSLIPKSLKTENIYYQEYVGGRSVYLLFHISASKNKYSVYSQENYLQQYNGRSMILCRSSNHYSDESLISPYLDLFFKEGFSGLVMVEVRIQENNIYMIEANPRLWGPSQLILDAKMNLFDNFALDNELISTASEQNYTPGVWYFWSGGLVENQYDNLKPDFINFGYKDFFENYHSIVSSDVYLKPDTIHLYFHEHKQKINHAN